MKQHCCVVPRPSLTWFTTFPMVSTSSGTFVMGAWHRTSSHAAREPETRRMPSDAGEMVITTDDHAAQPLFHGCRAHGSCSPALPWKRNSGSCGTFLRGRVVCSRLAAFIISIRWARLDLSGIRMRKYNFEAIDLRAMCIRLRLPAHFDDGKPQLLVSESLEKWSEQKGFRVTALCLG